MSTLSTSSQKHLPKTEFAAIHCQTILSPRQKVNNPKIDKRLKSFEGCYSGTSLKSKENNVNQKCSLDVPKIYISSEYSSSCYDRHRLRGNSPPPRRFSEVSFLKTLLDTLPMERNDSVDSADDLSTDGVDGGDDICGEITPAPNRRARKISTASLGCLRESLKSSRSYGKPGGNERMQRSRSASQMMTTSASVEKMLFRNRLM